MTAIIRRNDAALQNAVTLWANARTDASSARRTDLLHYKAKTVTDFFTWCTIDGKPKHPAEVTALDVKAWQAHLESQSLAHSTVYARISQLSSFYEWMIADETLGQHIGGNPVRLARPKAPKAYQTESTQALTDDELRALLAQVKGRDDVIGKRDYALLLFYMATGMRRSEVISLRWGDVKVNGGLSLAGKVKGGDYREREIADPRVRDALLDYLETSGRLDRLTPESPLWTRHDRAGNPGKQLTSHAFAKRFKRYARLAGLGDVHLHQTRHTYARLVGDATGSVKAVQEALGHANEAATRIYMQRLAVKRDHYSKGILDRLDV